MIIKERQSCGNIVARFATYESINLLHLIMKMSHCVSAHTFHSTRTYMRNRFTLSSAPHMEIINLRWKVEGTQNCKLLHKPKRSPSSRCFCVAFFGAAPKENISICGRRWICCGFAQHENMYRNKLSSRLLGPGRNT